MRYEKFQLKEVAERACNFLTTMVDEKYDYLPYWFIQINAIPAFAKHVRVDDAELVASWYEATVSIRKILGEDAPEIKDVENAFARHLMKSWGPKGLRYHEYYPWSNTNHSSFHEMAYVLSALNRLLQEEPDNVMAEKRASELVRGMRSLVIQRKIKTFWSGDFPITEKVYEFPGDLYLRDGGFDQERVTGRGEEAIRNGIVLQPLVVRAEKFNDNVALDLAVGLANHILGLSRYFNYRGEFFGHVHSAVWVASGLARLGRLVNNEFYQNKANQIFNYVLSLSSSFGWVPEYAQWFSPGDVFCETCCIKDMIQCAFELIDNCKYDYWDIINKFVRNQLVENQIKDGCFVSVDNSKVDTDEMTWKDIDKRVVGGWSGGSEPNSISLSKFRCIAGCCVGTAPQALHLVWERIVENKMDGVYINLPIDKEALACSVETGYPNDGYIKVTAKKSSKYYIRIFDWMGDRIEVKVNGNNIPVVFSNQCILLVDIKKGDTISVVHKLETITKKETVRAVELNVVWRGPDVVDITPHGNPLRLYQREKGMEKEYPRPNGNAGSVEMKPTNQK